MVSAHMRVASEECSRSGTRRAHGDRFLLSELDSIMSVQPGAGARSRASVDVQGPRAWSAAHHPLDGVESVRPASEIVAPHGNSMHQTQQSSGLHNAESKSTLNEYHQLCDVGTKSEHSPQNLGDASPPTGSYRSTHADTRTPQSPYPSETQSCTPIAEGESTSCSHNAFSMLNYFPDAVSRQPSIAGSKTFHTMSKLWKRWLRLPSMPILRRNLRPSSNGSKF
jgi:hypothetical protein